MKYSYKKVLVNYFIYPDINFVTNSVFYSNYCANTVAMIYGGLIQFTQSGYIPFWE